MAQHKDVEEELQKLREAKEAIERQLAALQERIDRTEKLVKQPPQLTA